MQREYILHINYDKSDGTRVCSACDEYGLIDASIIFCNCSILSTHCKKGFDVDPNVYFYFQFIELQQIPHKVSVSRSTTSSRTVRVSFEQQQSQKQQNLHILFHSTESIFKEYFWGHFMHVLTSLLQKYDRACWEKWKMEYHMQQKSLAALVLGMLHCPQPKKNTTYCF